VNLEPYWLVHALAYWFVVLLLVPLKYVRKVLLFGFLGGFVYTWLVQIIAVPVLGIWRFKPDVLTLWGIPFFFTVSWFGVTVLYGYLLLRYPRHQLWIIIAFLLWPTSISIIAHRAEVLFWNNWSNTETFMFAIFSHILLLYVFKYMHKVEELGAKEDMIPFSLSILKR
jgi:hypothetical protein